MNIWIIMPFFLFAVLLGLKIAERKAVYQDAVSDRLLLSVSERASMWKVSVYLVFVLVVFFGIQPANMTISMAFFKWSLVTSVFFLESILKTKLYITEQDIYLIERFRNRRLVYARRIDTTNIYHVAGDRHYPGVYHLSYFGLRNTVHTITVSIALWEERQLFKRVLKDRMNLSISREQESPPIRATNEKSHGKDVFTPLFALLSFAVSVVAVFFSVKGTTPHWSGTEMAISALFASLSLPLSLYFFSYFFMLTSGMFKRMKTIPVKTAAYYLVLASFTIPFYELLEKGMQTSRVFLHHQLNTLLFFALVMCSGFLLGIGTKAWKEKKEQREDGKQMVRHRNR